MSNSIRVVGVQVAYANHGEQVIESLEVPVGSTTGEVICASGLLQRFPEIDLTRDKIGIFSELVGLNTVISAGDRVEIYRPLRADPKEVRRQLAALGKTIGNKAP